MVSLLPWKVIILYRNQLKLPTHHRITVSKCKNVAEFLKVLKLRRCGLKVFTSDRIGCRACNCRALLEFGYGSKIVATTFFDVAEFLKV